MRSYKVKELLKIRNGKDHKELKNGNIPVFGSGGLMRFGDRCLYDRESILLPRKGTLSNIQYVNEPFWTVDTIYYTEINEKLVDGYYLYSYLTSLDLSKLNSGTGVPSMTFDAYYDIEVKLPELKIQKKVSNVLKNIKAKIELNNRINAELEAMAKTIYDYWFVQFDFPDKNGKPYKSSGGKMVWNEELKREIPEGWEVKSVNDLMIRYSDKSKSIESKQILSHGKYPVITQDNGEFVSGYTNDENPIEDIPIIIFGDHSCTLRYVDFSFFRGADGTQIMRFNDEMMLYMFLFLKKVIYQLPGYGKYERHFKYLKEFLVLVPSLENLKSFSSIIKPMFEKISTSRFENQQLAHIRDWLLPMLMNGQAKVS